jgi:RNA polymerase sigma-70 factor (ECF subfamily)
LGKNSDGRLTVAGEVTDAELCQRLQAGDGDVVGLIYDRHAPALYRLLCGLLGNAADAEDALQEVFLRLVSGRTGRVRDLRAYLTVAARNQALTCLRKRGRETNIDDAQWESTVENKAQTFANENDWQALLTRLPLEQREVIVLKVWQGLTFAEIAPIVKASPNTVMSRYRYGIEKLRVWCGEEDHV